MKISGQLLRIDNETVPSLRSYRVRYEKIWRDRERNMAGDMRATLLDTDIILDVEFGGVLLQDDLKNLLPKLRSNSFPVTFYDPEIDDIRTGTYYVEGYEVDLLSKHRGQFNPLPIIFNPISRSV